MIESKSIFRELMSASILLALVTSLLFISGASYRDAYLTQWGVEPGLINYHPQNILIDGASIWFVGGIYIVMFALATGVVWFAFFSLVNELSKSTWLVNFLLKIYEKVKPTQNDEEKQLFIIKTFKTWTLHFLTLVVFLSSFLWLFYKVLDFSGSQGKDRAIREYKEFSSGKVPENELFKRIKVISINGKEAAGYILANSESLVVLYTVATNNEPEQVQVLPINSINYMKTWKNTNLKVK